MRLIVSLLGLVSVAYFLRAGIRSPRRVGAVLIGTYAAYVVFEGFTLAVAVATAGVNWLVFARWLSVPFPVGVLGF